MRSLPWSCIIEFSGDITKAQLEQTGFHSSWWWWLPVVSEVSNWNSQIIPPTNSHVAKIGYVQDASCTFCRVSSGTVNHLLYKCFHTDQSWKHFKKVWFILCGKHVEISLQDVLIGKLAEASDLLNCLSIFAKWSIWISRKMKSQSKYNCF